MDQKTFRRHGVLTGLTALFCAVVLSVTSCNLPEGPEFGKGTVTLLLPETPAQESSVRGTAAQNEIAGISKSVISYVDRAVLTYKITLTGPGGTKTLEMGGGGTTVFLDAGEWTIDVLTYTPANVLAGSGSKVITVIAGRSESVEVPMVLDPVYEAGLTGIYIHNEADLRRVGTDFAIDGSFITHFYLENDIVLTQPWTPLGNGSSAPFRAVFDGQGHSITIRSFSGPKVDGTNLSLGLFAFVDTTTIRNLTIKYELGGPVDISGISTTGMAFAGGGAGRASDTIFENVKVLGNFSVIKSDGPAGDLHIGGIAGYASGGAMGITNCHVSGGVHGYTSGAAVYSGGITGMINFSDSIQTSSFTGIVSGDAGGGTCVTGGIVGMMENGLIISSYASARVEARGGTNVYAGGITGYIRSLSAGGGAIMACYAWARVKADGPSSNAAGGITGYTLNSGGAPNVNTSYARGTVEAVTTGTSKYAGGIAGLNEGSIEYCIALNDSISSSTSHDVHGIAGTQTGSATYVSNYAASDIQFSRAGSSTNSGLIGDTTYTRAGFAGQANQGNYDSAWNFSAAGDWKWIGGCNYPVLSWQTSPPADPASL